ncbi:MAG: RsmB/NOP family class I SAM-dependent RNA methyltransferase [Lachnospiraceae bacterium]|nr:RsmB/NOP family class I SAM-dependent RNA methyltransferase [Lachnospiraceae bacterium]
MELPVKFSENMRSLLGPEDYERYLACFNDERLYGLRLNRLKTDTVPKGLAEYDLRRIPWIDNGYFYKGDVRPAKHPYYYAGLYYLQEPSAMTPANRLDIKPGDKVLDICAAPGGKSTELGAKLGGTGLLFTNDISNSRAQALLKNIELFGIGNAVITSDSPEKLAGRLRGFFDKVLIDAPCSGEGMFRKDTAVMKAWDEGSNERFCALQRQILGYAASMLKPGGLLMYSTCTFAKMENEENIAWFIDNHPDFSLLDIDGYEGFGKGYTDCGDEYSKCVRIFPHRMEGEGHFLALLKKSGEGEETTAAAYRTSTAAKELGKNTEFTDFLKCIDRSFDPDRFELKQEGKVYYIPEGLADLSGLRIMRTGLFIGEIKKNRFEPSQALAMNLRKDEYDGCIDLKLEDPRVLKYLKGETIDSDECGNGLKLVCVDGHPLGWGKLGGGTLKNKYLQGWRWQ